MFFKENLLELFQICTVFVICSVQILQYALLLFYYYQWKLLRWRKIKRHLTVSDSVIVQTSVKRKKNNFALGNLCVWLTGLCWISSVHCQTILVLSEFDKYIYWYACWLFSVVSFLLFNYNCIKFLSNVSPTICSYFFVVVDMQLSFFRNIWQWFLQGVLVQLTVKKYWI